MIRRHVSSRDRHRRVARRRARRALWWSRMALLGTVLFYAPQACSSHKSVDSKGLDPSAGASTVTPQSDDGLGGTLICSWATDSAGNKTDPEYYIIYSMN